MKRFLVFCAMLAIAACAQEPPPAPVAAAPPPPPPAPPPPSSFNVYFDYNSARLGSEAKEIVKRAADAYRAGQPGTVQVTGFTDPTGSAGYNQRLSLRRAHAVAAELEQDGVPNNMVAVTGQGETSNAPTPAEGRRVEVLLGGPPPSSPPPAS